MNNYPCENCRYYFKIPYKEQWICSNEKCDKFGTNPLFVIDPYEALGYKECFYFTPREIQPKE